MDLAYGHYPSPMKSDARASKSISNDTHTIVFQPSSQLSLKPPIPPTTIPFIVGVHLKSSSSIQKLPFSIWAVGTTDPHQSDEINRVSCAINSFNLLSEHSKDELWKNMPKLHRLAQGESAKQRSGKSLIGAASIEISRQSSLRHDRSLGCSQNTSTDEPCSRAVSFIEPPPSSALEREKNDAQETDMENMERFISRSGRMKMKHGSEQPQSAHRLDKAMNPNNHRDLFALNHPEDLTETISLQDIDKDPNDGQKSKITTALTNSKSLKILDMDFEAGMKYGLAPSPLPNASYSHELLSAFQPERYITNTTPTLPVLTQQKNSERDRKTPLPNGEEKSRIEFPFLVPLLETNAQPQRKWRKIPDPKPVKYTLSK
jgi:hypothetical protein